MRIAVWNAEWAEPSSRRGCAIRNLLEEGAFELVCLCEAKEGLLASQGYRATSTSDYGYPLHEGRRKVILWSRYKLECTDNIGSSRLPPGRFVSAEISAPEGRMVVVAVCIPWRDAHVRTGRCDRQPWEDHMAFLAALQSYLRPKVSGGHIVVLGDFNQRIPRSRSPVHVARALKASLDGLDVATAGMIPPLNRLLIDHLAHSRDLTASHVCAWADTTPGGERLSDHDGVSLVLHPNSR